MLDKIVVFCGRYGSGKTTLAKLLYSCLIDKDYPCYQVSFSNLLKQKLGALLKADFINNADFKNESVIFKDKLISCRYLLQTLGDIIRSVDKDYFATHLCANLKRYKGGVVIIDDLRYYNEIVHLVSFAKRIHIVAINSDKSKETEANHSSENYDELMRFIKPLSAKNNHVSLLELDSYKARAVNNDKAVLLNFVL